MKEPLRKESFPLLLSVPQVARELSLGRTTIYQLINSGRLETVRIGKALRVTGSGLTRFVEELHAEQGGHSS